MRYLITKYYKWLVNGWNLIVITSNDYLMVISSGSIC